MFKNWSMVFLFASTRVETCSTKRAYAIIRIRVVVFILKSRTFHSIHFLIKNAKVTSSSSGTVVEVACVMVCNSCGVILVVITSVTVTVVVEVAGSFFSTSLFGITAIGAVSATSTSSTGNDSWKQAKISKRSYLRTKTYLLMKKVQKEQSKSQLTSFFNLSKRTLVSN